MADTLETAKPLNVEMVQATRPSIFVADDGFKRVYVFISESFARLRTRLTVAEETPVPIAMCAAQALSAKMEIRSTIPLSV